MTVLSEEAARMQFRADFDVSRETMDALELYRLLLLKWSQQINLIGPATLNHFWQRHVLDCAQVKSLMGPDVKTVADFGSGAGLPGLILAALLNDQSSDYHVNLVEASAKRCGFLREAARVLGVTVTIIPRKIEDVKPEPVDLVTARAFAPLHKLLDYAHPWSQHGARVIFLKGEEVQREIDEASTSWSFQSTLKPSVADSRGCILEIVNLARR